jgi:hypothetical protein
MACRLILSAHDQAGAFAGAKRRPARDFGSLLLIIPVLRQGAGEYFGRIPSVIGLLAVLSGFIQEASNLTLRAITFSTPSELEFLSVSAVFGLSTSSPIYGDGNCEIELQAVSAKLNKISDDAMFFRADGLLLFAFMFSGLGQF